jgi:aminoglycoside 2'-N-acetyltransferase I
MMQYLIHDDASLDASTRAAIRELLDTAFEGDFSDADADHAAGGIRVLAVDGDTIIGHAALIGRQMQVNGVTVTVGYVEGVAVHPDRQGQGHGRALMQIISARAQETYAVSMLSTGEQGFYEKLGWVRFLGKSYVTENEQMVRTADEDEGLMVLTAEASWHSRDCVVVCDWRAGDVW